MKTTEERKIIRRFQLAIIWTLFFSLTASGIVYAAEKMEYNNTGQEAETVKITDSIF